MFKSSSSTLQLREDGCYYRTVLEELCKIDNQHGSQKCESSKRVFRKCPGDRNEIEIESEGKQEDRPIAAGKRENSSVSPYEGRVHDV